MLQKEKDPLNIFVWYVSDEQTVAHPSKAINQKGHFAVQDDPTIYFMQIPPPLHTVQPKSIRLGWKNSSRPKSNYFLPYCHSCYKNQVDNIFAELLGRMKRFMSTNSNRMEELVAIFLQIFQTHAIDYWSVVTTVLDIGQEGLFGHFLLQAIISTIQVQGASQHNHHQTKSATRKHLLSSSIGLYEWKLACKKKMDARQTNNASHHIVQDENNHKIEGIGCY